MFLPVNSLVGATFKIMFASASESRSHSSLKRVICDEFNKGIVDAVIYSIT